MITQQLWIIAYILASGYLAKRAREAGYVFLNVFFSMFTVIYIITLFASFVLHAN